MHTKKTKRSSRLIAPYFKKLKTKKQMKKLGVIMCLITAGLTRVCSARSGGLVRLYLANAADVTSFTLNGATGAYSAVTMESGKVFFKFEFKQDSGQRKETGKMNDGAFSVEHIIEMYWENLNQTQRNLLQSIADASPCGMIAIVEDANALKWVVGYNEKFLKERPLKLETGDNDSGKAFTDANGSLVQLKSTDNEYDRTFTGSVPV